MRLDASQAKPISTRDKRLTKKSPSQLYTGLQCPQRLLFACYPVVMRLVVRVGGCCCSAFRCEKLKEIEHFILVSQCDVPDCLLMVHSIRRNLWKQSDISGVKHIYCRCTYLLLLTPEARKLLHMEYSMCLVHSNTDVS